MSRLVVATLLAWLQERPLPPGARDGSPPPEDKTYLRSLTVSLCSHCLDAAPSRHRADRLPMCRRRWHPGHPLCSRLGEGEPRLRAGEGARPRAEHVLGRGGATEPVSTP